MDELKQKPSDDDPVTDSTSSESTADSKDLTEHSSELRKEDSSTSVVDNPTTSVSPRESSSKTSTASVSAETPSGLSSKESSDLPSGQLPEDSEHSKDEGSLQKPTVKSQGPVEMQTKSTSTAMAEDSHLDDKSMVGASSGPGVPPLDGAGGPGSSDVMAKMMDMMAKESASATPKAPGDPKGAVADMMAMMSKGGGMPDMMAMMSKGGGMPDMMAMMSEGGNMPDLKAMMSKMEGGPMGMAKLFDCIIDVSLARPDSDSSDDDEDSVTIEIPCQYCSRLFTNQMSLKTHILVAHEHEDTSVLNLRKLVIDKGKRSVKDHHGTRRKRSRDCEKSAVVEAANTDAPQSLHSTSPKVISSQEDLSAAESSRGVKRGRSERKESEAAETSGASGVEEGSLDSEQVTLRLGSGAVPSSCVPGSPPDSRKRSARLRSLRSGSGDSSSQVTTKKSKSSEGKPDSDSSQKEGSHSGESLQPSSNVIKTGDEQPRADDNKSHSTAKESSKHKPIKTAMKHPSPIRQTPVTRGKRPSRKDHHGASSDTDVGAEAHESDPSLSSRSRSRKGRQSSSVPAASVPTTSSSAQGSESPVTSRRSLRTRKSH